MYFYSSLWTRLIPIRIFSLFALYSIPEDEQWLVFTLVGVYSVDDNQTTSPWHHHITNIIWCTRRSPLSISTLDSTQPSSTPLVVLLLLSISHVIEFSCGSLFVQARGGSSSSCRWLRGQWILFEPNVIQIKVPYQFSRYFPSTLNWSLRMLRAREGLRCTNNKSTESTTDGVRGGIYNPQLVVTIYIYLIPSPGSYSWESVCCSSDVAYSLIRENIRENRTRMMTSKKYTRF